MLTDAYLISVRGKKHPPLPFLMIHVGYGRGRDWADGKIGDADLFYSRYYAPGSQYILWIAHLRGPSATNRLITSISKFAFHRGFSGFIFRSRNEDIKSWAVAGGARVTFHNPNEGGPRWYGDGVGSRIVTLAYEKKVKADEKRGIQKGAEKISGTTRTREG